MKREDKMFIVCVIMIVILASFRAWMQYDYVKQQEETNRIVKENPKRYLLGVSYYGYILIGIFNGVYRTDDFRKTPSQIIHLL